MRSIDKQYSSLPEGIEVPVSLVPTILLGRKDHVQYLFHNRRGILLTKWRQS